MAKKNVARLASLAESTATQIGEPHKVAPELFLTDAGEAGIVKLCYQAPSEVLARMAAGDEVQLRVKGQRLIVEDGQGEYLGEVEPKYESYLTKSIMNGSRYTGAILSLEENKVKIMIKKVYQHPGEVRHPIFPMKGDKISLPRIKDSLLRHVLAEEEAPEEEEEQASPEGFSIVEDTSEQEWE